MYCWSAVAGTTNTRGESETARHEAASSSGLRPNGGVVHTLHRRPRGTAESFRAPFTNTARHPGQRADNENAQ